MNIKTTGSEYAMTETAALVVAGFENRVLTRKRALETLASLIAVTLCFVDKDAASRIQIYAGEQAATIVKDYSVDGGELAI